jgi:hypothetical protein
MRKDSPVFYDKALENVCFQGLYALDSVFTRRAY